jgi:hypothetical protein
MSGVSTADRRFSHQWLSTDPKPVAVVCGRLDEYDKCRRSANCRTRRQPAASFRHSTRGTISASIRLPAYLPAKTSCAAPLAVRCSLCVDATLRRSSNPRGHRLRHFQQHHRHQRLAPGPPAHVIVSRQEVFELLPSRKERHDGLELHKAGSPTMKYGFCPARRNQRRRHCGENRVQRHFIGGARYHYLDF